jgi:Zn-dependent peptidase ImmA (M78 family)
MIFSKYNRYKDFCKFVKKHHPIKIQRRRVPISCYGWYKSNLIVVDRNADEDLAIWVVIHELGHFLAKDKEKIEHDRHFGVGYYKAYNLYLNWIDGRRGYD